MLNKIFDINIAINNFWFILSGLGYTLGVALTSFVFGTILGFVLVLMRRSRFRLLRWIATFHVSFMRGTPTLVFLFLLYFGFLFLLYFGLPFLKITLPALVCALLCFSIASSAYISEVLRSAMDAVDNGQWEAAMSLGMSYRQTLQKVIVPQAFRIAIPPLSNVLLDMIKGSSLVAMISLPDIFQNAKIVGGREQNYMTVYILVAIIYWIICLLFEQGQRYLEKKMAL